MNISLCHLVKVIPHNNYKVALRNIADVYAFLDKLGEKLPRTYDWTVADDSIQKYYNLSHQGEYIFVNKDDKEMWNLLYNLKVLEITEDFVIVVGYERFNS